MNEQIALASSIFTAPGKALNTFDEIAVIVPVYAGRPFLRELCERSIAALETISPFFSVVLVDDRSPDNVWALIQELSLSDHRIKGLQLSRNFGQHHAITAGIDHARARWYVVMDCDLQDAPEDIPLLYQKALQGFDMVVAINRREGHSRNKRLASRLFYRAFNKFSTVRLTYGASNFRIFSDAVAIGLRQLREQLRCLPTSLSFMGFEVAELETSHHPRSEGASSYSFRKLAQLALNAILAHSELPLKITAGLGLVIAAFSIVAGLLIVARTLLYGIGVLGWASLIVSVFIVGGVQIFCIGVVGIYVGKTFAETKKRPLYFIRDAVNIGLRLPGESSFESQDDFPAADKLPPGRVVLTE